MYFKKHRYYDSSSDIFYVLALHLKKIPNLDENTSHEKKR